MQKTTQVVAGYRLSPQQKKIWLLQQSSQVYYAQCAILIEGDLEPDALESALKKIIRKHEILRTTLGNAPDFEIPLQVILENTPLPYRKVDLSGERSEDYETLLGRFFREEARPFELNLNPFAHFCLGRLSESKHVLLVSLHSLCADSRTLKNLFKEISRFYAAELEGKELTEEALPYLQFSEWQNELFYEKREDETQGRGRRAFSDLILPLEFDSAGIAGSAPGRFSPEFCVLTVGLQMTERIESIGDLYNFSASDFLLACWQILLWWHTSEQEIISECLFDGRQFDELHDVFGLFAGYAPAPANLGRGLRFDEVVERTRKALQQSSISHELYLDELADADNRKEIDRTHRIGFEYEEWPEAESAAGVTFSYWKQYCCIDRFKLKLGGYRKADGLTIEIQYDPARFAKESIELIGERYLKLVESAVERQQAPIGDLEIFGRKEMETLLVGWNRTEKSIPANEFIHKMVATQAERTPDMPALFDDRQRVSYRELNRRANQIGHYLQALGVGQETVVGVCFGRSVEMIVAILGVLKAGGAYLPLDPESPPERSAFMLEDAGVGVVLTERASKNRLPVFWGQSICLDEEWENIDEQSGCEPESEIEPENQAYLIYTSGSTGRPKGVMVRHRSLVNYTLDICRQLELTAAEYKDAPNRMNFATVSTITADLGNTCIYPSLVSGGCLHILSYETATDGALYEEYLKREPIDVLKIVPSHLSALLGARPNGLKMLPSRFLIMGGEALPCKLAEQIKERGEGCELINHYGPTETTIGALTLKVGGEEKERRKSGSIPIGRPIANAESYVLDRELIPAPVGVDGELYLGGEGVSRGYWNRPELTADKFIPNPFGRRGGERVYRTGDLVRHLPGGKIEFIGRADNQVKVRGYRVELGEIEAAIRSHPGVREAVVVLRENDLGEKRLVGYVVGRNKKTINGQTRRRLPNGMAIVEQNRNETEYLYEEIFKRKRYFKHGIDVPDGGCVFDVGANIGLFSLFVDQGRKGVRVYAFEPIKPIYESLRINAQLYGGAGIKLYQMGIGEEERAEWFTYYRGYSMMSGESRYAKVSDDIEVVKRCMQNDLAPEELLRDSNELLGRRFEGEKYHCDIRRLTDVMREEKIERIDLLKVDVQRAEMDVLRGLEEEDWKKISQIVMEVHDKIGAETEGRLEQIRELLKIKGYEVAVEQDEVLSGTDRFNLYAWRNGDAQRIAEREWREARVNELLEDVTSEELLRYVRERVPEYMAPATIVILEELPLTRNGKLDRNALPDPEIEKEREETDGSEPLTAYEELIGGIWKEVLNVERARPGDNFFELGGHSLLATQAISRVRSTFGIEIGVMSIFDEPTVRGLAARIENAMSKGLKDKAPPLVKAERDSALPLSFAQLRLWFLDQLIPNNPFHNIPRAVRVEGDLNLEALDRAINELIRRHEVLRTRIEVKDGKSAYEPVQVIDPWKPRKFEVLDLTHIPEAQREETTKRIVRENAITGFDLRRGPVVRAKVLKLKEDDHVVLFSTHHIASDGWSMGVISREIETLYRAYLAGEESPLPELDIQYADFAKWQRAYLADGVLEEEVEYWKEQLANMTALDLPTDHIRPAAPTYRGATEGIDIGEEVHEGLKTLSRREGATMFMTLMAAFKAILMRHSGQEDISVGTVIANRTRREMEGVVGFFVNTLVMRTDLSGNPSFRELLARERKAALGAYAHQEAPFEKLVEAINPERDLSASPLFQVTMLLQNTSQERLVIKGAGLSSIGEVTGAAQHELSMNLREWRDGVSGYLRYSCDLFERETIERMVGRFERFVAEVAGNAEQRIQEIELMNDLEKRQLIEEWSGSKIDYGKPRLAHEQFAQQARREKEAIAMTSEQGALSYGELDRLTNQLAHYLQRLGVGPEVVVGLCVERSMEMVMAVMAALKAGGSYLPLEADYPMERLTFMLEDAGIGIVLTERKLVGRLPPHWGMTVLIDEEWENIRAESESEPESAVGKENSAYVIYTSGSTGRPKGVIVEHKALGNLIEAQKQALNLGRQSRVLQFASISFDASVWEIFGVLASGGTLHVYGQERLTPGADLVKALREHEITMVTLPPSVLEVVKEEGLPQLDAVIAAGEACTAELVDRWGEGRKFINAYGPTESTVCASMGECAPGSHHIPSIGRPIANTGIYIFENDMNPAPIGICGELHISGEGLARAYLGRPELTAERFLPDSLSQEAGGRLYRTGDLARYKSNGLIEFSGRIDRQVKIRGYRVELGEIEMRLDSHPAVRRCAVISHPDPGAEKKLTAYLVCENEMRPSDGELQSYLRERLPEFMLPSRFAWVNQMPLLPSGKVDRLSLPLLEELKSTESGRYIAPRRPVEEIVAGVFEQLLNRGRVGMRNDFFELGGHSLSAMQAVSRIRDIFGVEVGVRSIFEEPTVERLSRRIERAMTAGERDEAPPLVRVERNSHGEMRLPLSFAQQRLWFIDQLEPDSTAYNIPGAVWLQGKQDLETLERVINEIFRRHETLRTRFKEEDGVPVQVIDEWQPRELEVIDLTRFSQEHRQAEVERRKREEAETTFDLSKGPLLRLKALKLEEEQHVLLFSMHHIISDRWSMGILIKEVISLFRAFSLGQSSPLPELGIQYADYTLWQRQWLQGEVLEKQSAYWKRRLTGCPSLLQLPTDRPRPSVPFYNGAYESFILSPKLSEVLKRLSRDEGVTLFMTMLAAFQLLLARYSGEDRVVVGTPIAGRNRKETEGLIGFFLNTLVMATDLSGNPAARELLTRVRETAIGAFMHQDLPFEKLVEEIQPERDFNRQPLFQVMFTFQTPLDDSPTISNLAGAEDSPTVSNLVDAIEGIGVQNAKFEISFTAMEVDSRMVGHVEYATDLYERESIVRFLEHFERLLEGITANQECPVMDLPLLSEAEWEQVLAWNQTVLECEEEKSVHQLFEEQADRAPDRIAVIAEGARISYEELNRRANQLGNYLRKRGIGPEVRVGIYLERGAETLVALLGISKAGGAYVPLDPTYPAERLSFMLEDAAAPLIVTQGKLKGDLAARASQLICLDEDHAGIALESEENIDSGVSGENLTYVIYTSGSTGRPKGAMITHRSAVNLVTDAVGKFRLGRDSRFLQFASLSFDVAVEELHPVWSVGGAVVLLSDDLSYSYSDLTETIERYEVTAMESPTAYWREWMRELLRTGGRAPQCLDLVITGDEKISAETFQEWREHEISLLHVYGVTEATVNSMLYPVPDDFGEDGTPAAVPIGKPIANTEVYLLDERLQPTPLRIPGEMYLGGVGLARGYLNRPELTAERFVPSPFGKRAGTRLYKSGDLARRSRARFNEGLEFVGRIDDQIKLRGYRIELGEIEAALKSHPWVDAAVAAATEDVSGGNKLIAYVAPKHEYRQANDHNGCNVGKSRDEFPTLWPAGGEYGIGEGIRISRSPEEILLPKHLKSHIRDILPTYMMPSSFVILDSLPLSPNGKVDRSALPAPDASVVEHYGIYVAPRTPLEEDVARIFREVLRIEDVGIYDDFFSLGGHSLLVIQVLNRVNRSFQVKLPIRVLFDAPNIDGLVAAIVECQAGQLEDHVLAQMLAEIGETSDNP